MASFKTIDYMKDHEGRKKVAHLVQTGNLRVVSTRRKEAENVLRNRIILIVIAVFIFLIGIYAVFF